MPCPLFPRHSLSKADPVLGSAAWQCGDQLNCHGSRVGQLCRKDVPQGATPSKGEGWSQDRPARTRKFRRILNMNSIRNLARRVSRDERGITGLETAIILIAFVVVATVFAFIVLTTGLFSAERGKETVFAGLDKARGTMEVRGGVVVTATGSPLARRPVAPWKSAAVLSLPQPALPWPWTRSSSKSPWTRSSSRLLRPPVARRFRSIQPRPKTQRSSPIATLPSLITT